MSDTTAARAFSLLPKAAMKIMHVTLHLLLQLGLIEARYRYTSETLPRHSTWTRVRDDEFLVGVGISDITGPPADIGMVIQKKKHK